MTDSDDLVRERRGPILVVRLNRPDTRNSLTPGLINAIGAAMVEAETDREIRVVVLTGSGDRAFCAGMDLRAFASGAAMAAGGEGTEAFHRLARGEIAVPVIGAANGSAIGGGLELLLGCDLIVASEDAQFGFPEVKRGLFPAGGGTYLGRRIPLSVALELTLTGDNISSARAYELGLVNAVVPPNEVLSSALAYAERIAANGPLGIAAVKELVRLSTADPARAAERLVYWQHVVFASDDAKEGAMAFVEKRPPAWQGH